MSRTLVRRCVALATVVACYVPAAPPSAAVSTQLVLAGSLVVTASHSASMTVWLPRATPIDVYEDITVDAPRGRATALFLKRDGAWDAPVVAVYHPGLCATSGCASEFPRSKIGFLWTPGSTDGVSGVLPGGRYTLYVVTDGAPMSVTIRLRGLSGRRTVAPGRSIRAEVAASAPSVAQPPASPVAFAGGSVRRFGPRGGANLTLIWKETPTWVSKSATGICVYDHAPASTDTSPAYQFPCPNARGGVPPSVSGAVAAGPALTPVGPGRFVSGTSAAFLVPPGEFGLGGYNNTTGPVTGAYIHQLWVHF